MEATLTKPVHPCLPGEVGGRRVPIDSGGFNRDAERCNPWMIDGIAHTLSIDEQGGHVSLDFAGTAPESSGAEVETTPHLGAILGMTRAAPRGSLTGGAGRARPVKPEHFVPIHAWSVSHSGRDFLCRLAEGALSQHGIELVVIDDVASTTVTV